MDNGDDNALDEVHQEEKPVDNIEKENDNINKENKEDFKEENNQKVEIDEKEEEKNKENIKEDNEDIKEEKNGKMIQELNDNGIKDSNEGQSNVLNEDKDNNKEKDSRLEDENNNNIKKEEEKKEKEEKEEKKEKEEKENNEEKIIIKRNIAECEEYDRSIKVIILGDSNVGKTTLIQRLINKQFANPSATLGIEYHTYIISLNEFKIRMQIWDTAGQEKFNSLVKSYYQNTEVGIFLYSIDKEESFDNVQTWYTNFKENSTQNSFNILIGNKKDLEDEKREVSFEKGENFAKQNDFKFFKEVTCKIDNEVNDIIEIFDEIGKNFYEFYKRNRTISSSLDNGYVASKSIVELGERQRKDKEGKKCCIK